MKVKLVLSDGAAFEGTGFGVLAAAPRIGEVVFNTSMVGYQEILTDPSYAGQLLCFTAPQIGNVGCNPEDDESAKAHPLGVIVRELSGSFSNHRARESLDDFCKRHDLPGISGVDTRAIVRHLRERGPQMGAVVAAITSMEETLSQLNAINESPATSVSRVTCSKPYSWRQGDWRPGGFTELSELALAARPHVVVLDCGVKRSMLRLLIEVGFRVTVVPAHASASEILELQPDALFVSNGPGDPADLGDIVTQVKQLIGKLPIFGICLGHQIVAQALGANTFKLKYGHRGANHPVRNQLSGLIEISAQNHGYAVEPASIPAEVQISHVNLNDQTVEGLRLKSAKLFTVQYHPESSPGPNDSRYLFTEFYQMTVG